VISKQSLVL